MPDTDIMRGLTWGNPADRIRAVLTDPDTYGTTLLVWCVETWGTKCLHDPEEPERGPWHPATFRSMLEETFGVRLPPGNLDKLMAAVSVVTSDDFFRRADRFVVLANVLAGDHFDPDEFEKADAVECAWAITEALLLAPPDDNNPEPFSDDVRHYVGFVLRDEGYVTPPDVLRIAIDADFSSKVRYGFADDPEMFEAINGLQREKTAEVESAVRDGLTDLLTQLKALPLQSGNVAELEKRIGATLKAKEPDEETGPEHVLD